MKWYSSCKLCSNMHELLRYCCCSNDSVLSTVHFSPTRTFSHCCDSRTVAQVAAQWRATWWSWDRCTLTPRECTSPTLCYVCSCRLPTHTLFTLSSARSLGTTLHLWCLQLLTSHPQLSCLLPPSLLIPSSPYLPSITTFLVLYSYPLPSFPLIFPLPLLFTFQGQSTRLFPLWLKTLTRGTR